MKTDELDYHLPQDRIATAPADPRDSARMLVARISEPEAAPIHARVSDLPDFLTTHDRLVLNTTRTLPARFLARNRDTGGKAEGLWLRDAEPTPEGKPAWVCMIKARRHRPGYILDLINDHNTPTGVAITLIERTNEPGEEGAWRCELTTDPTITETGPALLERAGLTALPPYIRSARKAQHLDIPDTDDRAAYQTVYASNTTDERGGSVAAPTAGLHFTQDLLARLDTLGVQRTAVTLHVGAGTFKPIESDTLEEHQLHAEWCAMSPEAQATVFDRPNHHQTGRVIAVGTTTVRTLEAFAIEREHNRSPEWLSTNLMIAPGHRWRAVDGMLTNFHLPRSSLMALVAARLETKNTDGLQRLKTLYQTAIDRDYRFYSYGDAMLILP